jgi:hypothetical protein
MPSSNILHPEFPEREEPVRHWIVYTNTGYYIVRATETKVWEQQRKYIDSRAAEGARLDQLIFNYQPVSVTLVEAIR